MIQKYQELLSRGIENIGIKSEPKNLYDPVTYILSLGGKKLRPLLTLLSYSITKQDVEKVLDVALAVEVFHNFTLMHDDIMDEAPLRRGKPTVHEKWNSAVAILSGDVMLVKVYDLLLKADQSLVAKIISRFNQIAIEVCEGQQIDMDFEDRNDVSEKDYIEMIRLKTAVLIGFSLELGAILAGKPRGVSDQYYQIGELLGLGFQLMDDYLDVFGDKDKFGKQVGGDIISNKKTYLLINALEMASGESAEKLKHWINAKDFNPEEKVKGVTEIYEEIGISNLTKMKMADYFQKAMDQLEVLEGDAEMREELKNFVEKIVNREK